jgi:sugar phosphate permease
MKTKVFSGATGRVFILLCIMYFIEYVDRVNLSVAAPLIKAEFGLSNKELGLALSAFGTCYATFQIIGGYLGDKFGPRKLLALQGLLWAAGTLLTGIAGGLTTLVLARLLVGTGEGGTIAVATRAMSNWVPAGRRGFAQGFTHSASRAAVALAPPIIIFMIPHVGGWRGAFTVLGLASLVWAAVWYWYFRDDPAKHTGVSAEELATLPVYADSARNIAGERKSVPWMALLVRIMPVTLVFFAHAWGLWMYLTWLPTFFVEHFHSTLTNSALYTSGVFVGAVVGNTLGGALTDWLYAKTGNLNASRRNVVVLGFTGSILFMSCVLFVRNPTLVGLSLAAALFFLELTVGPVFSVPIDVAPEFAGVATGFVSTAAGLAAVISPFTFGYIIDATRSYTLPFLTSIAVMVMGIMVSFWMRPDKTVGDPVPRGARTGSNELKEQEA